MPKRKPKVVDRLSDEAILELGRKAKHKRNFEMTNLEMHAVLFLEKFEQRQAAEAQSMAKTTNSKD